MLKKISSTILPFCILVFIQCKSTPTLEESRMVFGKAKLELITSIHQDHPYLRFKSGNNDQIPKNRIGFIESMEGYKPYLLEDKKEYEAIEKMIKLNNVPSIIQSNGLCNVIKDQSINRERKKEFILNHIQKISAQYDTLKIDSRGPLSDHCLQVQMKYLMENQGLFSSNEWKLMDSFLLSSKTLIARINSYNCNLRDHALSPMKPIDSYAPLDSSMYQFAMESLELDSLAALYFSM